MGNQFQEVSLLSKRKIIATTTVTALFGALIAAGVFITIPLPFNPVPIVLQNLFALLSGLTLGPIFGGAAVALYLIAGALGAPIFAGASGGFVHFFSPTGGYLLGYLLCAVIAGLLAGQPQINRRTPRWRLALGSVIGLLSVYLPGIWRLKTFLDISWAAAIATGFLPFAIGDAVKAMVAVAICPRLRRLAAELLI